MAEKIKRRARVGPPQPSGKVLKRQDRDIETCAEAQEFPLLPGRFFAPLLDIKETTKDRKRRNWMKPWPYPVPDKNGVISRRAPVLFAPDLIKTRDEWRTENIFGLTDTGYRLLKSEGRAHRQYVTDGEHELHRLMRSTVGASLKIAVRKHGWTWITKDQLLDHPKCPPETAKAKSPLMLTLPDKRRLEMDDLYRWQTTERIYKTYFFEANRSTEDTWTYGKKHSSLEEKVRRYDIVFDQLLYEAHFGIKGKPMVLFVTLYESEIPAMLEMVNAVSRFPDRYLLRAKPYFDSKTWKVPPLMTDLFTDPWQSVKGPVFLNR